MTSTNETSKVRATYRPPVVEVVLHHSETHNNTQLLLNDNPTKKS